MKKKKDNKQIIWKKNNQRCCVLVSVKGKTYQVALEKEQQEQVAWLLPQLFEDNIIKILPDELPITLPKLKK